MEPTVLEEEHKTNTRLQLEIPARTKLSPKETITGNRYDLVLVCQPNAMDNYPFYDSIIKVVEEEKDLRMYSPHSDLKRGHTLENSVNFSIKEAIPRTRGVLAHLTTITPEIKKMFDATYLNSKPFILFYSFEAQPFSDITYIRIKEDSNYYGEVIYSNEREALEIMRLKIEDLIKD